MALPSAASFMPQAPLHSAARRNRTVAGRRSYGYPHKKHSQSNKKAKKFLTFPLGQGVFLWGNRQTGKQANRKGLRMTIKDVEKLTGLTAKSIRYYESKHLIAVGRNQANAYRHYTEEDVTRFKWIKLFRYLGFSIEEIERLLAMNADEMKQALHRKADAFAAQEELCESKRTLCLLLAKEYENSETVVAEYNETIDFLESDEMSELKEQVKEFAAPNLITVIAETLICMAPVFWLFYNILAARTDLLLFNGVVAILCTALTTWNWMHYAQQYKKNRERVKRKTRNMLWLLPALCAAFLLGITAVVALTALFSGWALPEHYLFFEHGPFAGAALVLLIILPVVLFCVWAAARLRKKPVEEMEEASDLLFLWNRLGKWRVAAIAAWLAALYGCAFQFTAVTADKIIRYSPWQPTGVAYSYADVEAIKTGFGDKNFSFAEYKKKGSFYYQITIDGQTVTFHTPTVNEQIQRYEEHTYLELEEFDRALTALGIPKEADETGWETCDLDREYVERFLRIIRNKRQD